MPFSPERPLVAAPPVCATVAADTDEPLAVASELPELAPLAASTVPVLTSTTLLPIWPCEIASPVTFDVDPVLTTLFVAVPRPSLTVVLARLMPSPDADPLTLAAAS